MCDICKTEKINGLGEAAQVGQKVFKSPEEIIEGVDLNYDLMHLSGYLVSLGWTEKVFPTEHVIALHQRVIDLYGNIKPRIAVDK